VLCVLIPVLSRSIGSSRGQLDASSPLLPITIDNCRTLGRRHRPATQIHGFGIETYQSDQIVRLRSLRDFQSRGAPPHGGHRLWKVGAAMYVATNWLGTFFALLTIITYTVASFYSSQGTNAVTTAKIFTVTSTISLISEPLLVVGQHIARLLTTWASFKRIEEFLLCAERSIPDVYDESEGDATCENPEEALNTPDRRIALRDASFGIKGKATLLSGPNIDLTAPDLWMVIGRVGSVHFLCVTYLRNALISNHCRARVPSSILSLESSISLPVPVRCDSGRSAIAHSIHGFRANNTIRDNVTFMHPFEAVWYRTVVSAGALEQI